MDRVDRAVAEHRLGGWRSPDCTIAWGCSLFSGRIAAWRVDHPSARCRTYRKW